MQSVELKPAPTTADLFASCPQSAQVALLAGLVPSMPDAHAICRITSTVCITKASVNPLLDLQTVVGKKVAKESSSGWIILLGYELGKVIEPKVGSDSRGSSMPPIVALRYEGAWIESKGARSWHGDPEFMIPLDPPESRDPITVGRAESSMARDSYIDQVKRTKQYIAAGDIYQANIAHNITVPIEGAARSVACELFNAADPAFGSAFSFEFEGTEHEIVSISPELFLSFDR
jgi:anthranilate/para-aminobenzoate synthase component I